MTGGGEGQKQKKMILWFMWITWNSTFWYPQGKLYWKTATFTCLLHVALFMPQQQSSIVVTETIWPPKLKHCLSLYKKSLQILNFEETLLVAAKSRNWDLGLIWVCLPHLSIQSGLTGAIFSISREQSDSVKSNQYLPYWKSISSSYIVKYCQSRT